MADNTRKKTDRGLNVDRPIKPQIERVRDTMDKEVPFLLEFKVIQPDRLTLLSLDFMPPPRAGCCAACECSVCEFFTHGVTETLFEVTYAYVPGTVHIFKDNIEIFDFTETDPASTQISVWAHNAENIVICYVFSICSGFGTAGSTAGGPSGITNPSPSLTPAGLGATVSDGTVTLYWS